MRTALWLAIIAQFGLIIASLALTSMSPLQDASLGEGLAERLAFGVVTLAFPAVGAICLLRRPAQKVGWFLSVIALGWAIANAATGYAQYAIGRGDLPAVDWALWLTGNSWPLFVSQGLFLLLLLIFPTGSLISASWRPAAGLIIGWTVVSALAVAIAGGPMEDNLRLRLANPAGAPGDAGKVLRALSQWLVFGFVPLFAVAAFSLVIRFRRSRGAERQQIKWVAVVVPILVALVAGTYVVGALLGAGPVSEDAQDIGGPVLLLVVAGVLSPGLLPVAIGVAILRYHLYDIDRLINRTLVYGGLTAILAATYVVLVLTLSALLRPLTGSSDLAVAASTLAVVAAFGPLRARIQRAVDRRFYRSRYDAERTVDLFAGRLRDELDLATLSAELIGVVGETVRPARAGLWLMGR
jgi:energy-converting hydrogenase Eha subunit C